MRRVRDRFAISPGAIGVYENLQLSVTTVDGDEYVSPMISFIVDESPPDIDYDRDTIGAWFQERISFPISVADDFKLASVEAALVVPQESDESETEPIFAPLAPFYSDTDSNGEGDASGIGGESAGPAATDSTTPEDTAADDEGAESEATDAADPAAAEDTPADGEGAESAATNATDSTTAEDTPAEGETTESEATDSTTAEDAAADGETTEPAATDSTTAEDAAADGESAESEATDATDSAAAEDTPADGEGAEPAPTDATDSAAAEDTPADGEGAEPAATDSTTAEDTPADVETTESAATDSAVVEDAAADGAGSSSRAPAIPDGYLLDLDASRLPDGPIKVLVRATDGAGNVSEISIPVVKDATPPGIVQLTPPTGSPVNGLFSLISRIVDASPVASITFSDDGEQFDPIPPEAVFAYDLDLASYETMPDLFVFEVTDISGNSERFIPALELDLESDKPIVDIQLPAQNTIVRDDFIISGMAFDDDDVAGIRYRFDEGEFIDLEGASSFEIAVPIEEISDNEHVVEFQAYDLGGVVSDTVSTSFFVSKADPVSQMLAPAIETTNRGIVTIRGESFDANGIESVYVSFDNGNTYNLTRGTGTWIYTFDSTTLLDGTYSLLIRAIDTTGAVGLYTSLLNVDNDEPALTLTGLIDGAQITDELFLQGSATDTIGLREMYVEIEPFDHEGPDPDILHIDLEPQRILLNKIDISTFAPGWYNLRVTAVDRADNVAFVSRNFRKMAADEYSRIDILFPAPGEPLAGEFSIQGRLVTTKLPEKAAVFIDGQLFEATDIDDGGFFDTIIAPELLEAGVHTVQIEATLPDETKVSTFEYEFTYDRVGPWVRIDTFSAGDYASDRPWITGRAGYFVEDADSQAAAEDKTIARGREVERVDYSLDNGRTFSAARGRNAWRFRLETLDLPDEKLNLLVRATYRNGERAVTKTQIVIDDTDPTVTLLTPEEGMRFNETIALSGTAFDANRMREVAVQLRRGGKGEYEVPSFIQGLYVEGRFIGATTWEVGVGLTFFDDNVKLQVQVGGAPAGRFSGFVVGAKLLANIALLPYSVLSQDLAFLSSSFALGATFSYFTMSESTNNAEPKVLTAVIGQAEIVRFDFERLGLNWPVIKAASIYVEGQLWLISSEVEGGVFPKISFGLRSEIF